MTYVYAFIAAALAALKDAGILLETAELMLLGATLTPDGDTAVGDLTAPTFTGYANGAIAAWTTPVDVNGLPYLGHAPITFSPTNGTNLPQYIYGAAILDANGDLVCVDIFETPALLSVSGQVMHVTPKVKFANGQPAISIEYSIE